MTTHKRASDGDAYRELPFLLKPSPVAAVQGRRSPHPLPTAKESQEAPPPPSAGFNPYFDLPPDSEIPPRLPATGTRR